MNIGNILKVADAIEQAELTARGIGFNMAAWGFEFDRTGHDDMTGHNCGTVACIAGWTCEVFGVRVNADKAESLLGLSERVGRTLFIPSEGDDPNANPYRATHLHAARVLRNLAITGKVDWDAAMKGDEPVLPPLPASRALVKQLS